MPSITALIVRCPACKQTSDAALKGGNSYFKGETVLRRVTTSLVIPPRFMSSAVPRDVRRRSRTQIPLTESRWMM